MPKADVSIIVEPELTERKLLKQLGELSGRVSKKTKQYLTQQSSSLFYKMMEKGITSTGVAGRVHLLRKFGASGKNLSPAAWDILSSGATQAQKHKTLLERQQKQQILESKQIERNKQKEELNRKREEEKLERLRLKEENNKKKEEARIEKAKVKEELRLQEEQRRTSLWRSNYKSLTSLERIRGKLGSTSDYKSVRMGLEAELLDMQENGATRQQYDAWKKRVESAYGMGESQLRYNTELEHQAKKTGDKSLLSEKTYKKFQTKELKGIDKLNKTAKENNVKITGASAGSGILSKLLGALSVQRVASYIWGAGKRGETQAVDEFASEIIYGGSRFNTLSRALEWQGISKGTSQQFLGNVADFAESEKWGRISGEQYNALGALSRASGADILSMMRRNDSLGIMQAIREIRSSGSLSADELRNYLRMAGWSEEMMVANAPELFPSGKEMAETYQSSEKVTAVNRRNALQNRRTNLIKNKNYNYMASGLNDIFTALSPFTWGDWATRDKEPRYLQDGIKIENNINVDAKGNSNADEIANKVADKTGESTKSSMSDVANMITNGIMGGAK